MRVGVLERIAPRAYDDAREILLGVAVALQVSGRPQGSRGVRRERHVAFVEDVKDQVEHLLRIGRLGDTFGANDQHGTMQTRANEVVGRLTAQPPVAPPVCCATVNTGAEDVSQ
ncbi:MAG: hypothetical protein IPI73_25930 [Betaproteobacteria bacterium]|nr:hypothetical protein [Betaproteobacteria bacterium]